MFRLQQCFNRSVAAYCCTTIRKISSSKYRNSLSLLVTDLQGFLFLVSGCTYIFVQPEAPVFQIPVQFCSWSVENSPGFKIVFAECESVFFSKIMFVLSNGSSRSVRMQPVQVPVTQINAKEWCSLVLKQVTSSLNRIELSKLANKRPKHNVSRQLSFVGIWRHFAHAVDVEIIPIDRSIRGGHLRWPMQRD